MHNMKLLTLLQAPNAPPQAEQFAQKTAHKKIYRRQRSHHFGQPQFIVAAIDHAIGGADIVAIKSSAIAAALSHENVRRIRSDACRPRRRACSRFS
jgi:hypothetical protein